MVFINRILPLLKNASSEQDADVRIINLTSIAHSALLPSSFEFVFDTSEALSNPVISYPWQWRYFGKFFFNFDLIRYAVSKAANVILTQELQAHFDKHNVPILSIAVHPGAVASEAAVGTSPAPLRFIARRLYLTLDQGAVTPLFAATAKEVRQDAGKFKGTFMVPFGDIGVPNPVVKDARQVKGLMDTTFKEVNQQLASNDLPPLEAW